MTASPRSAGPAPGTIDDDRAGPRYRFDTFTTSLLVDDLRFRRSDPAAGDLLPALSLPTTDGGVLDSRSLGDRPTLIVFGSRTCPVTESAVPRLVRLHRRFGDRVRFVLVNTREAHPGDEITQPSTPEEKLAHAVALADHHGVPFEVSVDDIDGTVHRVFSPKPNSAYLVDGDGDGVIRYRAHWANDDRSLAAALDAVAAGRSPRRGASRAMVRPLMRAVGHLPGVVAAAGAAGSGASAWRPGPLVERDVWRAAPPLPLLGGVSRVLRPLPVDVRGPVAAGIVTVLSVAVVSALVALT